MKRPAQLSMALAPALVLVLALAALARPALAQAPPLGIWEIASGHDLPLRAELAFASGGVLVVSDRVSRIVGVRPDSGLTVWSRELTAEASIHPLETSHTAEGAIVVVADTSLRGFRADVGTRLWEVPMKCAELCSERIIFAGPVSLGGDPGEIKDKARAERPELRGDVLLVARGGAVQSELARLDPRTGRVMWQAPALHPRRALVAPDFIAVEEAIAPFGVVFLDPADGTVKGRFERRSGAQARPLGELAVASRGEGVVALDLRPGDGALANVVVLDGSGRVVTERQMGRPAALGGVEHLPVEAHRVAAGFGVFTPVPAAKKAVLSVLRMEPPWTVRTELLVDTRPSGSGPLGSGVVRFGGDAAWFVARGAERTVNVTVVQAARAEAQVDGFAQEPAAVIPVGSSLLLVGLPAKDGASLATVDRRGFVTVGASDLSAPVIGAAFVEPDLVLVTRGANKPDRIERLSLVPWGAAIERLKSAHAKGGDITPIVTRLSRFYPIQDALGGAVDVPRVGELSPADKSLVVALRDAWKSGDAVGALDGLRELIEREPDRSERRLSLIQAGSELTLDLVLAAGGAVKPEIAERLVALTRITESAAQRCAKAECEVKREAIAVMSAAMGLVDEPLAGADLLGRAPASPLATQARLELARRALFLLRKSAGTLRTDTSRQMLVSGLRFFLHFDLVMGERAVEAATLLDSASHDAGAAMRLDAMLTEAAGPGAKKKALGPGLCQMACEAALNVCGEARARLTACQDRCVKTGAVRFSTTARPTHDPRWFCR